MATRRFEEKITIEAPASRVYDYVSDFTKHGEWAEHGLEVTKDGDGPVAVGTTFSTTAKQFGTQREKSTVTELTPGSAFGWESRGALGTIHHWFAVSGNGGSTTLTKGAELAAPSFLAKVMGWRIAREMPKALHGDLEKIKAKLQAE